MQLYVKNARNYLKRVENGELTPIDLTYEPVSSENETGTSSNDPLTAIEQAIVEAKSNAQHLKLIRKPRK